MRSTTDHEATVLRTVKGTDERRSAAPMRSKRRPSTLTEWRGWLPVIGALVAIGVAVALATLLADNGTKRLSLEDYDAALLSAIETLVASDGVEGIEEGYVEGQLASAVWFDSRPNGDVVVVQREDLAVTRYGWLTLPSTDASAAGAEIATTIHVRVGAALYEATLTDGEPDGGWAIIEPYEGLAFGLALLLDYHELGPPTEVGEVTFEAAAGGGGIWTMTTPYSDGQVVVTWQSGTGGELQSYSYELVGVSGPNRPFPGLTSGSIRYTPLIDPDPIVPPDPEAAPDPGQFGLPPDFPFEAR